MLLSLSRASLRRSVILGSLAVAFVLGASGVRICAGERQAKPETKASATTESKSAPLKFRFMACDTFHRTRAQAS